jgi:hypothetical protein
MPGVEELRERQLQGQLTSIEFLKGLLELARDVVEAEQEVVPEEEIDRGKAALTELFESARSETTPIVVERVVDDIDEIVRVVRFDGRQQTSAGERDVKRALSETRELRVEARRETVEGRLYGCVGRAGRHVQARACREHVPGYRIVRLVPKPFVEDLDRLLDFTEGVVREGQQPSRFPMLRPERDDLCPDGRVDQTPPPTTRC